MALAWHSPVLDAQWDLAAYYRAAQSVWKGESPYTLQDESQEVHLTNLTIYVYPPLFARVLSPFSALPFETVRVLWLLLQVLAFESLYWLGLRLFGQRFTPQSWGLYHLAALPYDGAATDFRAGNTALVEAALLAAWAGLHLSRPLVAGALLGALAAVKPFTAFVALWDLVRSRMRPFLAAAGISALLYLVMFFDGDLFAQYREFLASKTFQRIMDEHTVGIYNNATVSVAFRLFTEKTMFKPVWVFPPLAYLMTFLVPVVVWICAFDVWGKMEKAGLAPELQNRLGFLILLPSVLLTIPRVADYTLVWLLVPLFFGAWWAWEERSWKVMVVFLLAGLVGNLPVHPGRLAELTYSYHLLHYRYVSLVLFWVAGWMAARRAISLSTKEEGRGNPAPTTVTAV